MRTADAARKLRPYNEALWGKTQKKQNDTKEITEIVREIVREVKREPQEVVKTETVYAKAARTEETAAQAARGDEAKSVAREVLEGLLQAAFNMD